MDAREQPLMACRFDIEKFTKNMNNLISQKETTTNFSKVFGTAILYITLICALYSLFKYDIIISYPYICKFPMNCLKKFL